MYRGSSSGTTANVKSVFMIRSTDTGAKICHAHHIQWLSRGGKDRLKNLVLVCPNHHAAIHQVDAPFDFADLAFDFKRGSLHRRERLLRNTHLQPAA
jgi:hypothetical protein